MAELRDGSERVTGVFASPEACDRAMAEVEAHRIAPDEAMVLGEVDGLRAPIRAVDADAVVLDMTDGWDVLELAGPGAREAFARISELDLPERGFVQGEVARVGVRVLAEGDRLRILVPAMWTEHVRERILTDAAELMR